MASFLPIGQRQCLVHSTRQVAFAGASDHGLPFNGVAVLLRLLCRGAVQGIFRGVPDHVRHWAVSVFCAGCCPGCYSVFSLSYLPLGSVRPGCCVGVLFRVRRTIGLCQGAVQGAVQGAWIIFAIGGCQPRVLSSGAVEGCFPGFSPSFLPWCCPAVLSRVLQIMFAIGRSQVPVGALSRVSGYLQSAPRVPPIIFAIRQCQCAVQGAVEGCCSGCSGPLGGFRVLSRVLPSGAVQGAPDRVGYWGVSRCC